MDCPACSRPIEPQRRADGSTDYACLNCGWGKGPSRSRVDDAPSRPAPGRVAIFCLGAVLIVFGPYVALRVGIPALFDTGAQAFADASDRLIAALNIHYWWIMAVYIFLAGAFSPTYDRNNVGWLGGLVDNPFSFQDDWERQKRAWAFFLLPGKVVVAAGAITWQFVTGKP